METPVTQNDEVEGVPLPDPEQDERPQARRRKPDQAALPEPSAVEGSAEPDLVSSASSPMPSNITPPFVASGFRVLDSNDRLIAICGASYLGNEDRARMTVAIVDALNSSQPTS